jgi:hypothetical protein
LFSLGNASPAFDDLEDNACGGHFDRCTFKQAASARTRGASGRQLKSGFLHIGYGTNASYSGSRLDDLEIHDSMLALADLSEGVGGCMSADWHAGVE